MAKFEDKWVKKYEPGSMERMDDAIRHRGPLKPRIDSSVGMIRKQKGTLDKMVYKLERRDGILLDKVAAANIRHDTASAKALAGEIAEMRKVKTTISMARLALEKIEIRLTMYTGLGDAVSTIVPVVRLMGGLRTSLGRFIPEAGAEITQMADGLNGLLANTMEGDAFTVYDNTDEDAERIMQQAAEEASESVESRFPMTPVDMQGMQTKES